MTGGEKKPTDYEGLALGLGFLAVVFCLIGVWTAPYGFAARAAITSCVFAAVAIVCLVRARRS